jgi:class 3 adenylate cyclase
MTPGFDPSTLTMTELIRLQTLLSQELSRRFERVAALVFTDVVDSTAYFAQFGDEAGRRLQQLHLDLLERQLAEFGGRLVDTAGDGAFATFASAPVAAQALVALQNAISRDNQHRPRAHQLCLRIGLHWGHVLTDGAQVTGDAVNLCARLAASAQAGEIRLSRDAFQEIGPDLRRLCRPLGPVSLKGIVRPMEALALFWRDPVRFPNQLRVRESGEQITLPPRDTLCFGRGETIDVTSHHDVVLGLPNVLAAKQVSRRHFELRARADGYVLKALSSQPTSVDGVPLQRDQEAPLRPGSCVQLAGVMTLDFTSPTQQTEGAPDETLCGPGVTPTR